MLNIVLTMIREKYREPSWIYATATYPIMMTVAIYVHDNSTLSGETYALFVGFIIFQLSINMIGMYFLGRRESGFLKAYVNDQKSKFKYYIGEIVSGYFCGLTVIVGVTLCLSPFYYDEISHAFPYIYRAALYFAPICILTSAFNLIPLKYEHVTQIVSVISAPLLLLALLYSIGDEYKVVNYINLANPIYILFQLINSKVNFYILVPALVISVLLSKYISTHLNLMTYWDK